MGIKPIGAGLSPTPYSGRSATIEFQTVVRPLGPMDSVGCPFHLVAKIHILIVYLILQVKVKLFSPIRFKIGDPLTSCRLRIGQSILFSSSNKLDPSPINS